MRAAQAEKLWQSLLFFTFYFSLFIFHYENIPPPYIMFFIYRL
ncbi:hypothetical protein CAPSP0001_0697 [Capnocytophaga sputigena ATCC 33612]|nr:hypothetical protein CAPSP0001_0697 [Capnocytophaga sputigena ATCC 33612]